MTAPQKYFDEFFEALGQNNAAALMNILPKFDITSNNNSVGLIPLMIASYNRTSLEVMTLIFDEIVKTGGMDLLIHQLTSSNYDGRNCIMAASANCTSSEVMKLFSEKIVEAGGTELMTSQLSSKDEDQRTAFILCCRQSSSPEVMKFLASLVFHFGLFKNQYEQMEHYDKNRLEKKAGIDSSSWTPDAESLAEIQTILAQGNFINAVHNNQHSKMKEILKNDLDAKKILDSKVSIIVRACAESKTTDDTLRLLFSEIKRVSCARYLKELLSKGRNVGETLLLSVCLHHPKRLEFFLDTIEEVGGEEFLVEQISKKRPSDGMACLFALCKFTTKGDSLALLVSKMFRFGRQFIKDQLISNRHLECIFTRPLDTPEEARILFLMANLYSMTGLFEQTYLRCDKIRREILSRICNIESGEWRRVASSDSSTMGDMIGEIKKGIKNLISKSTGPEARLVENKKSGQEDYEFL